MRLYKLTDQNDQTQGQTRWGENITHSAVGEDNKLCTSGVIHAYTHPFLAMLFNCIQGKFDEDTCHMWESEGEPVAGDGTKKGCKTLTTLKRIEVPKVTIEQRVRFAILSVLEVYHVEEFKVWAINWLSGKNRSAEAAKAAWAAGAAAEAAVRATWTVSVVGAIAQNLDLALLADRAMEVK